MASSSDADGSAQWPLHAKSIGINKFTQQYSPSADSTTSSYSDSVFSADAPPSSQSSDDSSDIWPSSSDRSSWISEDENPHYQGREVTLQAIEDAVTGRQTSYSTSGPAHVAHAVAPECRQHPRRTQRLNSCDSQDGKVASNCTRPPPSLVRQSERKDNFVDSLVDTTTQMIETIWPLSVLSCGRETGANGKQQNLIGLRTFVQEVLRRSKTSYSTLQVALYYLILVQSCIPKHDFTMEQSEDSSACRAMQCGRRMFLAALILASKYLQDRNYSARAWSKISGLRTGEIHNNEMTFLSAVNWKLHIPEPVFHRWTDIVLRYSPSAQVNTFPRSSPVSPLAWKSIIPLLTPDLNTIPSGVGELSRNAGYNSPRSGTHDMSPPPIPVREESYPLPEFEEATPTRPHAISRALEQTPRDMKADERILPPLPHLGSLPTPQLTPQTGTFCTPAVGASGLCPGKSMGHAMAHIQKFSLARSTLDNPHQRRTASSAATPSFVRRPSLASSISSVSSPESMVSDSSSRPSRSSSISSAASNWAVPQSNLLMQVTRQCANQQIRDSKEEELEVKPTATDGDKTTSWFAHRSSVNEPYLKPRTDHAISYESDSQSLCSKRNLQVSTARSSSKELCSKSRAQNVAVDLHTRDRREAAAAAALSDLQLNHAPTSIPAAILPPPKGRKRSRPNSVDLSVQSSVRDMIAPRCLGDITNRSLGGNRKENVVLPDARPASSFLLPKYENARPSSSHSNSKPALSGECLPRKRTCAGSDRGRRDEARLMMQSLKAREGMHAIETLEGIM